MEHRARIETWKIVRSLELERRSNIYTRTNEIFLTLLLGTRQVFSKVLVVTQRK